jgi:hypothetical protein
LTTDAADGQRSGMRWEERILDLFDDLELQAEGLALAERDALVAEQSRAEYAEVDLAARLHASTGSRLVVEVSGVGRLEARLARVGDGWCLLDAEGQEWLVAWPAVGSVRGLAEGGVAAAARPATARLGLGSALRGVAEGRAETLLHRVDASVVRCVLGRVGRDFVEVRRSGEGAVRLEGTVEVVPFGAVAAVTAVRGG